LLSRTAAAVHHPIVAQLGIEADVCNDNIATTPMWRRTTICAAADSYGGTSAADTVNQLRSDCV
jgi:hypothetical protein